MKHFLSSLILLLTLTFVTPHCVFTQPVKTNAFKKIKVPRSKRRNTTTLAHYLTDGVSGDSLKVVAIASWMVTRYKYDYKALKSGKWSKRTTDQLLKKRKALCGGFADLFKEICMEAGINAETVIGYTKSWNYEPYDSLIRAEHAWNVVQVDGQWRPADISWSTGYIVQKKQRIRKTLYLWFNIPYNFKYKFIHQLTYDYMFTDPKVFVRSHDPLQPYWQLLKNPVPIKAFEMDSTNEYLENHDSPQDKIYNFNYYINNFRGLPDKDKHLKGALQAFDYNKKNHRILGIGYFNYTTELQNEIDPELPEETQIEKLDTCIILYDKSANYYKEYSKDNSRELKRRTIRNKRFRDYLLKENKAYIHDLKNNYKKHKKTHYNTRVDINKKKGLIRRLEHHSHKYSNTSLDKVKRPVKENGIKIAKAKNYITELNRLDSLLQLKNTISLDPVYSTDRQLNHIIDSLHTDLLKGYKVTHAIAEKIAPYRYGYNEYSRKFIDPIKDTIGTTFIYNQNMDATLNQFYDSLLVVKDSISNYYDTYTNKYVQKLKDLNGLKRVSMSDLNEDEDYRNNLTDLISNYQIIIDNYDSVIHIDQQRLPEIVSYLKPIKKTIRELKWEIKLEYKRYHILNRHYRHMHYFYKWQAYYLKKEAINRVRVCKEEIAYLERKIKIRDAELKKTNQ